MKWFYNLKTSVKLISAFLVIAAIMAFIGFYGLNNLGKINNRLNDMYSNQLVAVKSLVEAQANLNEMRNSLRKLYMVDRADQIDQAKATVNSAMEAVKSSIETFRQTELTTNSQEALRPYDAAWQDYVNLFMQTVELKDANRLEDMEILIDGDLTVESLELQATLKKLIDINIKEAEQARSNGQEVYSSSSTVTIIIVVAATILSILFGYAISQVIARPLRKVVNLVTQVADGDLRNTINLQTKDEIGALSGSIDQMVINLRGIATNITNHSHSLSAAAQQISASTEEIASSSSNQASSAQMISELFNELSIAIHSVAQNTDQASDLSEKTMRVASEGNEIIRSSMESMNEVSGKMSRLEDDSQRIGEIIEVIEDIADQTNLLALNAAIEAARAGEQGRGFAVVADEVRKLAERSAEATKQITGIIRVMQENTQKSVQAVEESVNYSKRTGESFMQIASMVNEAGQKVSEIAAASEEQAAQSSTVLTSVESISAATEEAAAASQETAATAQSLTHLASDLQASVSIFKID
ncbi:methyl-accepting chemotaxis protein [Cohnella hongkongensis]|uniref:Methyl-accepting chemotaxis protein n=1 Tax=Cohnella hongkongensis TaxID=178337 RepID=A0ABV9FEJ2_9BACL